MNPINPGIDASQIRAVRQIDPPAGFSEAHRRAVADAIIGNARAEQGGFLTAQDLETIRQSQAHRLFQVIIRAGGCRLMCAAQDVAHLIACLEAGGDYVRDVSIPANVRYTD